MTLHDKFYHWYFGDNILRDDYPSYVTNHEIGVVIRFNDAHSYGAGFEYFYEDIADVQFYLGRPDEERVREVLEEAWEFLCHYDRKEEQMAQERDSDPW